MQLQLELITFKYEQDQPFRTVTIDGEPWFYALEPVMHIEGVNWRA